MRAQDSASFRLVGGSGCGLYEHAPALACPPAPHAFVHTSFARMVASSGPHETRRQKRRRRSRVPSRVELSLGVPANGPLHPPVGTATRRTASAVMGDESLEQLSDVVQQQQQQQQQQQRVSHAAREVASTWNGSGRGQRTVVPRPGTMQPDENSRLGSGGGEEAGRGGGGRGRGGVEGDVEAVDGLESSDRSNAHSSIGNASNSGRDSTSVLLARQKAFVKRVVKLGLRRRAGEVLDLMRDAEAEGSPPFNLYMYNACITALARCSRWRQALAVLDGMRRAAADADRQREATDGKYRSSSVADGGGGSSGGAGVGERYGVVRPDVVSYSAAITACGNGGQRSRALALLEEMRADGVPPNVVSYNAAAHACVNDDDTDRQRPQSSCSNNGFDNDHGNDSRSSPDAGRQEQGWSLVLGLMSDMRAEGLKPDCFTFSTAIAACGRAGQWERALSLLDEMGKQREELRPSIFAINAAIAACARAAQWERALGLLYRMTTKTGELVGSRGFFDEDVAALRGTTERGNEMGGAGGVGGALRDRPQAADGAAAWPEAGAISFNSAMEACAKAGRWQEGVALLSLMRNVNVCPDICSYASVLACLRAGGQWERALELLDKLEAGATSGERRRGDRVSPDLGFYGAVISTLGEAGEWERALALLRRLQRRGAAGAATWAVTEAAEAGWDAERFAAEATGLAAKSSSPAAGPNLVCYNAALAACAKAEAWSPALVLLEEMETRGIFDAASFNCAIHACRGEGQWRRAIELLERMSSGDAARAPSSSGPDAGRGRQRSVPAPDVYSYASAITACGAVGQVDLARNLVREMERAGVKPTVVVFNALIAVVARGVSRDGVSPEKRSGPADRDGSGEEEEDCAESAAEAASATAVDVSAKVRGGSWERARELLAEMRAADIVPTTTSYNLVLSACQRAGAWEGALEVLREMKRGEALEPSSSGGSVAPLPDIVSFNTAMGACGRAGRWEDALALLDGIAANGLTPDAVSFNTAAAACARVEEWSLALEVLDRGRLVGAFPSLPSNVDGEGSAPEGAGTVGAGERDGEADSGRQPAVTSSGFHAAVEAMASCQAEDGGERVDSKPVLLENETLGMDL